MATLRRKDPAPAPGQVSPERRWMWARSFHHLDEFNTWPASKPVLEMDLEDRLAAVDAYLDAHGLRDAFEEFVVESEQRMREYDEECEALQRRLGNRRR